MVDNLELPEKLRVVFHTVEVHCFEALEVPDSISQQWMLNLSKACQKCHLLFTSTKKMIIEESVDFDRILANWKLDLLSLVRVEVESRR